MYVLQTNSQKHFGVVSTTKKYLLEWEKLLAYTS